MPEQPEVVPYGPREGDIIRLGPRVDRKQGHTVCPGDAANVQNQTWCVGDKLWEDILGEKGGEDVVGVNECVNVLVGNAVDGKVGPGLGVANVVDQNGYMELLEGRKEGAPVVDTLARVRTYGDDLHASVGVCGLEFSLDLGEFFHVPAVEYEVEALGCELGCQRVPNTCRDVRLSSEESGR